LSIFQSGQNHSKYQNILTEKKIATNKQMAPVCLSWSALIGSAFFFIFRVIAEWPIERENVSKGHFETDKTVHCLLNIIYMYTVRFVNRGAISFCFQTTISFSDTLF
jgi:hypothetical protein